MAKGSGEGGSKGFTNLCAQLAWREFLRLVHRNIGVKTFVLAGAKASEENIRRWRRLDVEEGDLGKDRAAVRATLKRVFLGRTGQSLIDDAVRELSLTGYISNRARQNVASFLTRDLHIDWRTGAEVFECMLVDHDVARI